MKHEAGGNRTILGHHGIVRVRVGVGVWGYLRVGAQAAQEALEVTVGHQLHHHQGGLTLGDHAQQTHLGAAGTHGHRVGEQGGRRWGGVA